MTKGISSELSKARIAANISIEEIANELDISTSHYMDLESYDDDFESTINLNQVYRLLSNLNLKLEELLLLDSAPVRTNEEATNYILTCVDALEMPIDEVEDKIGWEVRAITEKSENLKEQPLMFFRAASNTLGVSIHEILPRENDT